MNKPLAGHTLWQEVVILVKGISRQVIVVQSPDRELFDQAIFILKEDHAGVTDEMLLKEANRLLRSPGASKRVYQRLYGPAWACAGAAVAVLLGLLF